VNVAGDAERAPTVSVCIRAYARPDGLRAAIGSVLAQTYRDFELVVSDDSGELEPVVRAFGDPRVSYHRNAQRLGPVSNIRCVFGLARGRLLVLLDDDDRWLPGFLEAVVERFERDPDLGIVFTDYYLEASDRRVRRRPALAAGRHRGLLREILEDCPVTPSAAVMTRAVWEQGERDFPLDDRAIADATMWIRASLGGWPFHYVDAPLAVYSVHAEQLSWNEATYARTIALFERFRFDDPVCERLRRARLAEARLSRAGVHLRHGRLRDARHDLARARAAAPRRIGLRGWIAVTGLRPRVARWVSARPALFVAVVSVWRRVRPPVSRHVT
jgi:glycosyltransferase involved in cell wall biosynthesis